VNDPTLTHLRPEPLVPIRSGAGESWPSRVLDWIYPNRGWAGVPCEASQEPAANRERQIRPTPGKAAGLLEKPANAV